ncbi:MAG: CRTAC1 family protein [Bryobacteraceae bacterium]
MRPPAPFVWLAVAATAYSQGMGGAVKASPRASPKAAIELPAPRLDFRDVAASAGVTAANVYGGERKKKYILEMTGNGAAVFDADNDGWRDLLLVGGTRIEGADGATRLYRNRGDGTFLDVTAQSGLGRGGWGQGVCAGDYDNDGLTDLLITYYGYNRLYRNLGKGRFADVTAESGLPVSGERWATGCAFTDFDRDGLLDLFVSNYLTFSLKGALAPGSSPFCFWKGLAVFCGPKGFPGGQNILYRNEGGRRFRDVSKQAGILASGVCYGLGVVVSGFDDDGWPDIYVACDSTPSLLYRNNRDSTFTEIAVASGAAYGDAGQEQGSMGVAAGDYDNDGRIDIVKTNFMDETSTLYRNLGGWFFEDSTYSAGLGIHTKFVGWGVQWFDADQDGWKDILIANGHIYPELRGSKTGESFEQTPILYWNLRNGAFRDITLNAGAKLSEPAVSRGVAHGDLDGDGTLETVVVNMNSAPAILKNFGDRGNAILIELVGTKSNRSAIGARVRVKAAGSQQIEEVRSGSSYASQHDFRVHFGLGAARSADRIEVRWPSGLREEYRNVRANQTVTIREGEGIIGSRPH